VNVSSGTGSLTWSSNPEHSFAVSAGNAAAYRSSKSALNALTLFYAQELAAEGFKVNVYPKSGTYAVARPLMTAW
jgi:NAD(P)-dependent dehydrogenase (short-subunit alcohol dehydrogenase family)